jgi:hypothetical protein
VGAVATLKTDVKYSRAAFTPDVPSIFSQVLNERAQTADRTLGVPEQPVPAASSVTAHRSLEVLWWSTITSSPNAFTIVVRGSFDSRSRSTFR